MKKIIAFIILITISFSFSTCKEVINSEAYCRPFALGEEYYWNPANKGDSVVFKNADNKRKIFTVVDKYFGHNPMYNSDTDCGCVDLSGMLMISQTDSILLKNRLNYLEDQTGIRSEDFVFTFDKKQSAFSETHITSLDSYSIDSLHFTDIKKIEHKDENMQVKTF